MNIHFDLWLIQHIVFMAPLDLIQRYQNILKRQHLIVFYNQYIMYTTFIVVADHTQDYIHCLFKRIYFSVTIFFHY